MEIFNIKNLSFSYPKSSQKAIDNISFTVNKGDFILLCGQSGSGKSTLLKMLKPQLTPYGDLSGNILYSGENINKLSQKDSATQIGFVMQNPHSQIVTDKVYHELAFGMENLGFDNNTIRLRVSEVASYFGLTEVFNKNTFELSGGQKQLLNLASVLALQPDVLILDEPTSQLDPLSAENFLNILKKLNRDFGITVILSEHNLEDVFDFATKVLVLEKGTVACYDKPENVTSKLKSINENHPMLSALPTVLRVYNAVGNNHQAPPLNINQGRNFLFKNFNNNIKALDNSYTEISNPLFTIKNAYFRYEKTGKDVLKGFNLTVNQGEIYTILGGNGSGKSTAVKMLCGILKSYSGKIKHFKRSEIGYLPQSVDTMFLKDTVKEELKSVSINIEKISKQLNIEHLLSRHPYDLSGGEMQRVAIAKLLLNSPTLLILDEPTKGLDNFAQDELIKILKQLQKDGMTIVIVTHHTEFACKISDRCGLLFDGNIIAENSAEEFFSSNSFYTTYACKMSRGFFDKAVTSQHIIELCKLNGDKNA